MKIRIRHLVKELDILNKFLLKNIDYSGYICINICVKVANVGICYTCEVMR